MKTKEYESVLKHDNCTLCREYSIYYIHIQYCTLII